MTTANSTIRIHGVIAIKGTKHNIIPEESAIEYCIKAARTKVLEVMPKVIACFEAGFTTDVIISII